MTEQSKIIAKHSNIATALAAAQAQMGKALKSSANPHFKSKYADLASVMDACMASLNAHGIAVIQPTGEDELGRYVETVLIHECGQELRCRVPLIIGKNDMQGYGSAVTYARRYGLMSMAGIAPEDDDGNAAVAAAPKADDGRSELERAVNDAIRSIQREPSIESLIAYFTDLYRNKRAVADDKRVIQAKDKRKDELAKSGAPITEEEIPY